MADALRSGRSGIYLVRVQVPPAAPFDYRHAFYDGSRMSWANEVSRRACDIKPLMVFDQPASRGATISDSIYALRTKLVNRRLVLFERTHRSSTQLI